MRLAPNRLPVDTFRLEQAFYIRFDPNSLGEIRLD